MKDIARRDSLVTIIGLALLAAAFVFVVYRPSQRTEISIRREIAQAERSINDIPLRVAELESLGRDVEQRMTYLASTRKLVPRDRDVHIILSQIASLAEGASLTITRLEPLAPVPRETYGVLPFRVSLSGRFPGVLQFLRGLEERSRLFTTEELTLRQTSQAAGTVEVDLHFSAYVIRSGYVDSAGNNASSGQAAVDTR